MMTGERLLHTLIEQMHICSPIELANLCLRNAATAEPVQALSPQLAQLVAEPDENAFWELLSRHEWLLSVLPVDGSAKECTWDELSALMPKAMKKSHVVLPVDLLRSVVELFVWLFYAPVYARLELVIENGEIETEQSTISPTVQPEAKRPRGRPVKVAHSKQKAWHWGDDSVDRYLQRIGPIPLIDRDEEVRLAKRIRQGDKSAQDKLVNANLRFVVSVAKQYQGSGMSLSDLIEDGNIGLIKAAKRFDETRGFKFISYAVWWIRQSILQGLAENSRTVRLPLNRVGTLYKIGKVRDRLEQSLNRAASPEEIAQELEISEAEVALTMSVGTDALSLDRPFADNEQSTLIDILADENVPPPYRRSITEGLRQEVEAALDTLTAREAEVIDLYFGISRLPALTLEQIGAHFNLTRERVRQIKENALRKLRHQKRSKALRSYWSKLN